MAEEQGSEEACNRMKNPVRIFGDSYVAMRIVRFAREFWFVCGNTGHKAEFLATVRLFPRKLSIRGKGLRNTLALECLLQARRLSERKGCGHA